MFKILESNSAQRPACRILAGIGAVLVVGSVSPAFAANQTCEVTFSVTNTTTLRALQFDIDYADAADVGDFVDPADCTFVPAGLGDVGVDQTANTASVGWANTTAFEGPGGFVTCRFNGTGAPVLADFDAVVTDAESSTGVPASPIPTVAATAISCVEVGSCSLTPETGCRHSTVAGKSKIQFKNNLTDDAKDSAQYQWKSGAATTLADLGTPVDAGETYSWCVYSDGAIVKGWDVAAGTGWAASGSTGFQFKGDAGGIAQIKMKSGVDGKASIAVKGKSKTGNFSSPTLPLSVTNVVSQFVIDNGVTPICFESTFSAPSKNTETQYGDKD